MKHTTLSRIWALLLAICLVAGLLPGFHMAVEAEAVSGVNSLTCADFISNTTRRNYIDTMMRYYINNNSSLSGTLDSGYSVVFMFEGGSDNYDSYQYVDSSGSTRLQAVCIVVQKNSSGNAEIVFYSENCSSIPDDANWVTPGYETSGSTTILDGIYSMYTVNHNGNYAAYNTDCYTGWYTPYDGTTGYSGYCNGINIHTRGVSYCGGSSYSWANSAGCQVIGYGTSNNSFNDFMKVTAGITWNSYGSTYNTFSSTSTGAFKGYYVVDRQLGLTSPSGTEYGSGSLAELYTTTDLTNITKFSTNARANANFGYLSQCDSYAAHCEIKITLDTEVNSLPCSIGTDDECAVVENCYVGDTYEATGLYRNSYGNLWYEVISKSGETGYVYAGECTYVKNLDGDISLSSGATAPNGHVAGNVFVVNGTISSKYSGLTEASVYIYEGFGTSGTAITGDSDTVSGKSYTLDNSTIDYNTSFNSLSTGKHTYAISTKYTNYYATDATTLASVSGTVDLMTEYFMVVSASVDQSSCTHSYTTTTVKAATCTANGTQVKSCATCGYVVESSVTKLGHSYGAWTTTKAATCTEDGSRYHTCSTCGSVETEVITAGGHSYTSTTLPDNCQSYPGTRYTCSVCGDSYDSYADSMYTAWSTTAPTGVASNLIQTKTQYRYADQVTTTSSSATLSGYELVSSAWDSGTAGSVVYAPDIASTGFSTSSSLYTQYNKSKVTASETDSQKIVINSDSRTGYLYYHWCYSSSYYSVESSSGSYTTFHAYYDTTDPSSYTCDTSDMSYKTSHSTCSNSEWWFVTDVYTQKYTTYNKVYTHAKWGDWSAWSDTAVTASDTRKVETQTLYRYVNAAYGDHTYVNGICSVCGAADPNYSATTATVTAKSFTLSFEDEILVNLYFTVADADATEMGMLVFNTNPGTASYAAADEVYNTATYDASTGRYMATTTGIAAKDMGDTRYYAAYVKLTDGSYVYSKVYDYSPKKYALNMLAKTSTTDKQKALCVAMLNYGAEAQKYFTYKADDLMNASLTSEQQALVVAYDSSLFNSAIAVDTSKVGNFAATSTGFSKKTATVSFESAFAINYYFTPNAAVDGNITFYYWTAEDYNAVTTLTPSNATGKLTMVDNGSGAYWAQISGIAAKQLDDTYYVAGIYTSDTNLCSTGVVSYSLSKYCINNAKDGNAMQGLASAAAMYGYYAKAYFA